MRETDHGQEPFFFISCAQADGPLSLGKPGFTIPAGTQLRVLPDQPRSLGHDDSWRHGLPPLTFHDILKKQKLKM
ncbi:MAG: hypothetical protein A3J07_01075 [Candidatus Doudnabacteria bacterium RIFCSPLOWO2_02_FULL_49_13]|nr:MAG: hypothetical protein A2760_01665 [Candidatus Doudnabacteria bacterium RIFCSPHIGHO2_01_FULL_50_67]OGF02392.1 MAG: hypothetical protein A3J07_01075 [Candidatus Doudnabacteria bacterium RIFCSPLOWO2_02_FULL_49_13]OGF03446.1 MAG: hypothetical protein A3H14_01485 [Candidatus Doudnabacteria bacterium RIFCSPLOWO2_12_FULL_49_8]